MEEQIKKLESKRAKDIARRKPKVDKKGLRVSILNPILLLIGKWKFEPTNQEDELVVKDYVVKKQLVWEVLSNGCRKKIEIEWSNIIGIRATLKENEPGILDVELSQPPTFYRELDNIDRRAHEKWIDGSDFTGGEASTCRRHLVMFPPGMLNKEFERMMSFDERLLELSQKPYPTFNITHFPNQSLMQNALQSNSSNIQHSSYQTLQLPHGSAFSPLPPTPVALPSYPMMFAQTPLGSSVTRNSNIIIPQESTNWRSVPRLVSNSNEYLFHNNNNNNIGPTDCFNGVSNSNWPMNSYGISNHHPTYPTYPNESFPNDYFSLSNWPTDEHGVWLPHRE